MATFLYNIEQQKSVIIEIAYRLLGYVGATLVFNEFENAGGNNYFLVKLDNLNSKDIKSIIDAIHLIEEHNESNIPHIKIQIPRNLVTDVDLEESCITDQNPAFIRNSTAYNEPVLTATMQNELTDTMGNVASVNSHNIKNADIALWLQACEREGVVYASVDWDRLNKALRGLQTALTDLTALDFAKYCASICFYNLYDSSSNLCSALGKSLPRIRLPKDKAAFLSIFNKLNSQNSKNESRVQASAFKALFKKMYTDRSSYYFKQDAKGGLLDFELLNENLRNIKAISKANNKQIDPEKLNVFEHYISSEISNDSAGKDLFELEWIEDDVARLFDKVKKDRITLSKSTIQYFDDNFGLNTVNSLTDDERNLVRQADSAAKRSELLPALKEFYERHRPDLLTNPSLCKKWEKLVYPNFIETNNFLEGFLTFCCRVNVTNGSRIRIKVRRTKKQWLNDLNYEVGCFFSTIYRSIIDLLGKSVEWEYNFDAKGQSPLFDFKNFYDVNRLDNAHKCRSEAKQSLSIKFDVSLIDKSGEESDGYRIIWFYKKSYIGLALSDDLDRLSRLKKLTYSEVARIPVSKKGLLQGLSLEDVSTMQALVSGNHVGSFVLRTLKNNRDLSADIRYLIESFDNIDELKAELLAKLDAFEQAYFKAIDDFANHGLNISSAAEQADKFADLLSCVRKLPKESYRIDLFKLLLKVGIVGVKGENTAIVTPWHPERLKTLALRQKRLCSLCLRLMNQGSVLIKRDLFVSTLNDGINNYLSPEVLLSPNGNELLTTSITVNGYSLLEEPSANVSSSNFHEVNTNAAASEIIEFIYSFLNLYPHTKNNLNILLYECDIAELPYSLIRRLSEDDKAADIKINLCIANEDLNKAASIYQKLLRSIDADYHAQVNNARSSSFIANLRVFVNTIKSLHCSDSVKDKPFDICILYDVISRQSSIEWLSDPALDKVCSDEEAYDPTLISYRYVNPVKDASSAVFLCCPIQTETGRTFVTAVHCALDNNVNAQSSTAYPVKQITTQAKSIDDTIKKTHCIADWVVSYDDLLEKQQLQINNINIVRYKRDKLNGRNLVISSTSDLSTLQGILKSRIEQLGVKANDVDQLVDTLKHDSLELSGNVLLRAAKSSIFACEMLGLMISKQILHYAFAHEISMHQPDAHAVAYFMLDDYATWFPSNTNKLADILALGLYQKSGSFQLSIKIAEAKYVTKAQSSVHKTKSFEQTKDSINTFESAFIDPQVPADRKQWLARLSELLSDPRITENGDMTAEQLLQARQAIHAGNFSLALSGASFVALYDDDDDDISCSEDKTKANVPIYQIELPHKVLKELFENYRNHQDVLATLDLLLQTHGVVDFMRTKIFTQLCLDAAVAEADSEIQNEQSNIEHNDVQNSISESQPLVGSISLFKLGTLNNDNRVCGLNKTSPSVAAVMVAAGAVSEEVSSITSNAEQKSHWRSHLRALIEAHVEAPEDLQKRNEIAIATAKELKAALNSYGMCAEIAKPPHPTPNGISVTFKGDDSLTIAKLENKENELLTTHGLRLSNISAEPGYITINIALGDGDNGRRAVSLLHLWNERKFNCDKTNVNTSFLLGLREKDGKLMYLNYQSAFAGLSRHAPHSLVAGESGSGKSVFLNSFILDIAATNNSRQVKLLLIDPKRVELTGFNVLPHMLKQTISDKEQAIAELNALVDEMDARYRLLEEQRVKDLPSYNLKVAPDKRLPLIFAIHDEFAFWMNDRDYKDKVTNVVNKLGVAARAAGIYLIVAAQRPDNTVVPMQLRDNLGNRLILKVETAAASKIGLDNVGAEKLLGRGQMLAKLDNKLELIQAPFVTDDEIHQILDAIVADDKE